MVGALAALVWLVWFSPVLTARYVEVDGLEGKDRETALAAAAVGSDTPLAQVDTAAIADRVRENPVVKSVDVQRSWPRTLVIAAVARQPFLVLKNPHGELQVVDEEGVVFRTVHTAPDGLPKVTVAEGSTSIDALPAAIEAFQTLPEDLRAQATHMTLTSATSVAFDLGDVRVVWGGTGEGERKVAVLRILLNTGPDLIDVSAPNSPVTR